MRKKMVTLVAAGALGVCTVAVAGPALATTTAPGTATAAASRVDRIKAALSGLVQDKTLTQSQADKVATTLSKTNHGPQAGPHAGPGRMGGRHGHAGPQGPGMAAAAKVLKMSDAELRGALDSGQSVAQVAKNRGVSVDALVAALVVEAKTHVGQEVTNGRITQSQAEERLQNLTARITERVNNVRPARPTDGRERGRPLGGAPSAPPSLPSPDSSSSR